MAKVDQTLELHLKLAKMLLKNKANLFAVSKNGQTPFGICLKLKKFKLIDLFIQTASFNKDPQLLFEFCGEIFDPKLQDVFRRVATQEKVKQETMNVLDKEGFTPFLRMIQSIVNFQKNMFIEIDNFRRHQKLQESDFIKQNQYWKSQMQNYPITIENLSNPMICNQIRQ